MFEVVSIFCWTLALLVLWIQADESPEMMWEAMILAANIMAVSEESEPLILWLVFMALSVPMTYRLHWFHCPTARIWYGMVSVMITTPAVVSSTDAPLRSTVFTGLIICNFMANTYGTLFSLKDNTNRWAWLPLGSFVLSSVLVSLFATVMVGVTFAELHAAAGLLVALALWLNPQDRPSDMRYGSVDPEELP